MTRRESNYAPTGDRKPPSAISVVLDFTGQLAR